MAVPKMLAGLLVGFCLLAIIRAPVVAVSNESNGKSTELMISEGLKNELLHLHTTYRMQFFNSRVDRAEAIISILSNHGYDVTTIQEIVDKITDQEKNLAQAMTDRDRQVLRQLNYKLGRRWHQFRTEVRESIHTC